MHRTGVAIVIVTLLVIPGCGPRRARVHGTLKYQGKPLGGAIITFFGTDNAAFSSAPTRSDGTYQVDGVPQGTVHVSVQVPQPRPKARTEPKGVQKADQEAGLKTSWEGKKGNDPAAPRIKLPAHYGNPETSELSFELKEPDQDYSIDLK